LVGVAEDEEEDVEDDEALVTRCGDLSDGTRATGARSRETERPLLLVALWEAAVVVVVVDVVVE
jgi:hypothetical protein